MSRESKNMKGTYFISSISITTSIMEYGISSIFTLFLLSVLNFSIPLTSNVFSYYYGLAYLLPILIGYISDKYLNKSTALTLGFISMIISQLVLSFTASLYNPNSIAQDTITLNMQNTSFLIGLFFLALGTSFSSISISHIINSINKDESSRLKGFSIFYPVLNIGVLIGIIITSLVVGDKNYEMYKIAFLLFALILTIGLISFGLLKNKYLVCSDGTLMEDGHSVNSVRDVSNNLLKKMSNKRLSEIKNLNLWQKRKLFRNSLNPHEKDRLTVFLIFLLIIILYRVSYSQTIISIVFFIQNFIQRDIGLLTIPVQSFSILDPIFILILSPALIKIDNKLKENGKELSFVTKLTISISIIAFCYVILASAGYLIDVHAVDKNSIIWIILFYFCLVISEIYFSVTGYYMVGRLAPEKYYSLFFGFFTATRAIAMFLSGIISKHFPLTPPSTFIYNIPINGLMGYFLIFVVMNLITATALIIYRKKIINKMHFEDFNQT